MTAPTMPNLPNFPNASAESSFSMRVKDKILSSIRPVIEHSEYVSTNLIAVRALAEKIKDISIPKWNNELQLLSSDEETIQYYFFVDSTQGCTWPAKGKERWFFKKDEDWIKGYYAFAYAIKQAILKDKKYLNAEYLSNISLQDFSDIFEGKGELQLLPQRHKALTENFGILKKKYGGQAANLVKNAAKDANVLVFKITSEFPSFDDSALFGGQKVYFWKRAQIFVNDIHFALNGRGLGKFQNMSDLTIFADYKLPQLLQFEGVMKYSEELIQKIRAEELLPSGSAEEVEIRAHTIHACELLRDELQNIGKDLTSQQLDWILWNLSQKVSFSLPHHRTATIYY